MMKIKHFIFLLLIKTSLSQDINKLFEDVNKEYGKFNALAASLSWDSSVNLDQDLQSEAAKYQNELIIWQQRTCGKLIALSSRGLLNRTQSRQSYLLCRGPKFTYEEARLSSSLYETLQSIYSNAEICIPIETDINKNGLRAIEAAILNYLSSVKRRSKFESNDYITHAAKLTVDGGLGKGKVFCLHGENDFQRMMVYSKVEEVLRWLWLVWREKVGPPMKEPYRKFVKIENQASSRNGYTDIGASWRNDLEIRDLRRFGRSLYENILPMYKILHGVTRFYLRKKYGEIVPENGPIPAHLLGDLWSQNWESLSDMIMRDSIDLNYSILEKNWTVTHMVKRAEDYYISLGLPPMTNTFWSKSIFERANNSLRCHGAAADMFKSGDFRMLYCLDVSMEDFYGLHHELGHIQYYMAYENQPAIFRQANAAFHEALGDTVMLGVMTPQHLHRLGLIDDKTLYTVDNINKSYFPFDTQYVKNKIRIKRENIRNIEVNLVEINKENKKGNKRATKITCSDEEKSDTKVHNQSNKSNKAHNSKRCYNDIHNKRDLKRNKIINKKNLHIDKSKDAREFNIYQTDETKNHIIYKRHVIKNNANFNVIKNMPTRENKIEDNSDNRLFIMKLDGMIMLKQALNKLPQIPFALIIDEYRWRYFEGSLKEDNGDFWKLALELQGIAPSGLRGEEYFDAAAKFHVPDNTPYIRYFLSSFLQHQLFETLCKAAVFGRRNPVESLPESITMNRCDIYGSKTVGKILKSFMSRGNSKHWRDILEEVTGERDITSMPLQRYYQPLFELLRGIVNKYRIPIGW